MGDFHSFDNTSFTFKQLHSVVFEISSISRFLDM